MNEELLIKILEELKKLNEHKTEELKHKEDSNESLKRISNSLMTIAAK